MTSRVLHNRIRTAVYSELPRPFIDRVDAFYRQHDVYIADYFIRVQPFLHPSYTHSLRGAPWASRLLPGVAPFDTHLWNNLLSNQRLELVGDAALAFLVAEDLYRRYPTIEEGKLTIMRENMVKNTSLYRLASEFLHLDDVPIHKMRLESSHNAPHTRGVRKMVADCIEALLGAIYIDQGFAALELFFRNHVIDNLYTIASEGPNRHPIPFLQTLALKYARVLPTYKYRGPVRGEDGTDMFEVVCFIGQKHFGEGLAHNTKNAKRIAAEEALANFINTYEVSETDMTRWDVADEPASSGSSSQPSMNLFVGLQDELTSATPNSTTARSESAGRVGSSPSSSDGDDSRGR
jgi:ribonuclease-3